MRPEHVVWKFFCITNNQQNLVMSSSIKTLRLAYIPTSYKDRYLGGLFYLPSHDGENWQPKEEDTISYIESRMVHHMQHNNNLLSQFKENCAAKYESLTNVLMGLKQLLLLRVFKPFTSFSASIVFTSETND